MSNESILLKIVQALLKAFCGGSQGQQHGNQQGQQGYGAYAGQQGQQGQGYGQQYNQQNQGYPPQQQPQPWQQQQGQSWSQAVGQHNNQQHHNNHHNHNNHNNHNYYQHGQNAGYPSKPAIPAGGIVGPHHPQHQNQDMINATNERYTQLRNQARHEGDEAHKCFAQSQEAYQRGDGERAHQLSAQGKQHQQKQDQLDDEASGWIFNENNKQSPNGTIDLHGLYVKEAIERTEQAIAAGQRAGQAELRVIVGKGIHSQGHVAKIKPAVEDLMRKYNLAAHIDPHNTGVLIVDLDGEDRPGRTRDAGGLVDQMGREQGADCVIM